MADAYFENWQALAQAFTERLLDSGMTQETIEGIGLFDAGEEVPMPLQSARGIIAIGSMEAEGLALSRWLIEHNADERTSRHRENEKRLEAVLLTLNQIKTSGDVKKGIKHARTQAQNASQKRTIKNESGETLDAVIENLARNRPGEKPHDLWPHLEHAIYDWAGDCEAKTPDRGNRETWFYEYTIGETRKKITYTTFRKKLPKK